MFGLNMMLTAPDGGVHADADVQALDGRQRLARAAHGASAAADAAPRRLRSEAIDRRRSVLAALGCLAASPFAHRLGAVAAKAPARRLRRLKSLGDDRYQIGAIVVDKRARRFSVPGRVHLLGKPLEYLATAPGGMKAYETLFELDTGGSEFNLACILVGLERDPKLGPVERGIQAPLTGQTVAISIAWSDGGKRRQISAAEAMLNPEAGVKPADGRVGLHRRAVPYRQPRTVRRPTRRAP